MKKIILLFLIIISCNYVFTQILNNPEHVIFDDINNRYLVTNYGNNSIASINPAGEDSIFVTGLTECLGMCKYQNTIYVSCLNTVKCLDISSGEVLNSIVLPVTGWLDGITVDSNGNLYVIDVGARKIYKSDISLNSYEIFLDSGLPSYPQDLIFDGLNNRLIIVCWANNSSIYQLNLDDMNLTTIPNTQFGKYDGIEIDSQNNFYASSHLGTGRIYRWKNDFTGEAEIIAENFNEPAGLCFNETERILVVPNFGGHSLSYINIPVDIKKIQKNELDFKIYPNPTKSDFTIHYDILEKALVEIKLYDISGSFVKTIFKGNNNEGNHQIFWNEENQKIYPGIYVCEIIIGKKSFFKKIIFTKK